MNVAGSCIAARRKIKSRIRVRKMIKSKSKRKIRSGAASA
jgi:hypothetical protein